MFAKITQWSDGDSKMLIPGEWGQVFLIKVQGGVEGGWFGQVEIHVDDMATEVKIDVSEKKEQRNSGIEQ